MQEWLLRNLDNEKSKKSWGIRVEQVEIIQNAIGDIDFPSRGVYVQGDFGLHNVLIAQDDPSQLEIIDPNPQIADPYRDLANRFNKVEFSEAISKDSPGDTKLAGKYWLEKEILESFARTYEVQFGQRIDRQQLLLMQIICGMTDPISRVQIDKQLMHKRIERLAGESSYLVFSR